MAARKGKPLESWSHKAALAALGLAVILPTGAFAGAICAGPGRIDWVFPSDDAGKRYLSLNYTQTQREEYDTTRGRVTYGTPSPTGMPRVIWRLHKIADGYAREVINMVWVRCRSGNESCTPDNLAYGDAEYAFVLLGDGRTFVTLGANRPDSSDSDLVDPTPERIRWMYELFPKAVGACVR